MLKRSDDYTLITLYGKNYLIPFGQKVADQFPAFKVNETGVWLWNHLDQDISEEDLLHRFIADNDIPASGQEDVRRDLHVFLSSLRQCGLLTNAAEDRADLTITEPFFADLDIAGLTIRLFGNLGYFSKDLLRFTKATDHADTNLFGRRSSEEASQTDSIDQILIVTRRSPSPASGARVILENEELCVLDAGNTWILYYPSFTFLLRTELAKDGSRCVLFLKPESPSGTSSKAGESKTLRYEIFHAIRLPFLILARRHGLYALHSASIEYKDKAWLFSAPSGTGKSTHVTLWEKAGWARQLNGDLNLIGFHDGTPLVYGMPWCGTSGIFTTRTVPLGGIILLRRGHVNTISSLSADNAALRVSQRLISPVWTKEMLMGNMDFSQKLQEQTTIQELTCTPDLEAAQVVKDKIDGKWKRRSDQ